MHTFQSSAGATFHFSSDFSGDVIVEVGDAEFRVPGDALLELVAKAYVLPARVSLLEDIGADSIAAVAKLRAATVPELLLNAI